MEALPLPPQREEIASCAQTHTKLEARRNAFPAVPRSGIHWPAARTERLIELKGLRFTSSAIGRELGVTRNAVIGKAHRLGLKTIGFERGPRKEKVKQFRPQRRLKEPARGTALPPAEMLLLEIGGLESHHCRWIVNDGGTPLYCGISKHPDNPNPWCPFHQTLVYREFPEKVLTQLPFWGKTFRRARRHA